MREAMLRGPVQLRLKIILSKDSVFEERENQQLPDFAQDPPLGADDASLPPDQNLHKIYGIAR
jgi:hypothetical protein